MSQLKIETQPMGMSTEMATRTPTSNPRKSKAYYTKKEDRNGVEDNESSDSDSEGKNIQQTKTLYQKGLEVNFSDKFAVESFFSQNSDTLESSRRSHNILHDLAEDTDTEEKDTERYVQYLQKVLERHKSLLEGQPDPGDTPLHRAFHRKNRTFIDQVLRFIKKVDMGSILTLKNRSLDNVVSLAIRSSSSFTSEMIQIVRDLPLSPEISTVFEDKDTGGNTLLHQAMIRFNESKNQRQQKTLNLLMQSHSKALICRNNMQNTPFQEREVIVRKEAIRKKLDELLPTSLEELRRQIELLSAKDPITENIRHEINKRLANPGPHTQQQKGSPPIKLDSILEDIRQRFEKLLAEDPIREDIKNFCLRNLSRSDAIEALYKSGDERQIEFDLAGLPNPMITHGYLESLAAHLKFESILRYVALPKISVHKESGQVRKDSPQDNKLQQRPRKRRKNQPAGLTDLEYIFEWLREKKVKKILKVIVVDNGELAHTDEAIENCLKGFQVEVWNWKRMDLCADVIQKAAGTSVEEVSLYASGNNSVLAGWSSNDGLANKSNFPELKRVKLYIQEGLETRARLEDNIARFRKRLENAFQVPVEQKPGVSQNSDSGMEIEQVESSKEPTRRVKSHQQNRGQSAKMLIVEDYFDTGPYLYANTFATSSSHSEREHVWLNVMETFAQCIIALNEYPDPDLDIKVAIVDDGVDTSLDIFAGKIASGKSFCHYPNSKDLISSYFVPSGTSHGTVMASFVCRICPRVKLYVARLDEGYPVYGQRQITAQSAAAAIKWAVECGVDIISMSWTIDFGDRNVQSEALNSAIKDAHDKGILMFGAASDQGSASQLCLPADSTEHCIAIGAATETGEMCRWVHHNQADFTCPGFKVPFKRGDGTPASAQDGSSVATALASGLAGVIIYCDRLLNGKDTRGLKSKKGMADAFANMSSGAGDERFPRVSKYFQVTESDKTGWKFYTEDSAKEKGVEPGLCPRSREKLTEMLKELKRERTQPRRRRS